MAKKKDIKKPKDCTDFVTPEEWANSPYRKYYEKKKDKKK